MRTFVHGTSAFAHVVVAVALLSPALAQPDPAAARATNAAEPDEEITVRGKALSRYRLDLEEAKEELIDVYNKENSGDDNDVVCRNERPTGSRMPQRVCRSNAQVKAESEAARGWLNALIIGSGQPEGGAINSTIAAVSGASDAVARTEESRAAIEKELERLARENKTLYRAALKYIEVEDAYIDARAEAASSRSTQ